MCLFLSINFPSVSDFFFGWGTSSCNFAEGCTSTFTSFLSHIRGAFCHGRKIHSDLEPETHNGVNIVRSNVYSIGLLFFTFDLFRYLLLVQTTALHVSTSLLAPWIHSTDIFLGNLRDCFLQKRFETGGHNWEWLGCGGRKPNKQR